MDAIQRSEFNNQTNNVANEKWTPGAKGKTRDDGTPLDHTYPQGQGVQLAGQSGSHQRDVQAGVEADPQVNGGSGTVQGITDSHQRQMEQKSSAYGLLELPVGHRPADSGTNLNAMRDARGGNLQTSTQGGGMYGPETRVAPSAMSGSMRKRQTAGGQEAQHGNTQEGVAGSRMGSNQHADAGGVHESNDAAGGLPRSPGNGGADHADSFDRTGSQTGPGGAEGGPEVHDSNDAAGGYPRSPGYANRLSGSDNMDDDTGFKRKP